MSADDEAKDIGAHGSDLTLIRWALSLTPLERLEAFEALMADVVEMMDAAPRT